MPRHARSRSRGRSRPSKPTYKWSGLQVGSTDVPITGVAFVLVGGTEIERYGKCTVVAVRGFVEVANGDTDSANGVVRFGLKLMKLPIDDAGLLTGDDQGLDSDEEDIAKRQLWSWHGLLDKRLADGNTQRRVQEVYVKVGVILGHPKEELILLLDASVGNRLQANCGLRVLLKLP